MNNSINGVMTHIMLTEYTENLHVRAPADCLVLYKLTILCFPASLIHRMLSLYCCLMPSVTLALICSKTLAAMWSVAARSRGSPDVHTQRKGPKPREKISLGQRQEEINHQTVLSTDWLTGPVYTGSPRHGNIPLYHVDSTHSLMVTEPVETQRCQGKPVPTQP